MDSEVTVREVEDSATNFFVLHPYTTDVKVRSGKGSRENATPVWAGASNQILAERKCTFAFRETTTKASNERHLPHAGGILGPPTQFDCTVGCVMAICSLRPGYEAHSNRRLYHVASCIFGTSSAVSTPLVTLRVCLADIHSFCRLA